MADTNTYDLFQKVEKWTTKEKFNALGNLTEIETGTEYNLTGAIDETDLASDLQTKISNKLTAPTTPTAESAVTMLADGTVGTKPLSEIGGSGGGGKLYLHLVKVVDQRDMSGIAMSFYNNSNVAFTPSTFKDYFRECYNLLGITGKGNRETDNYPSYAYINRNIPGHDNDVITFYKIVNGQGSETTLVLSEFNNSYGSFSDTYTEV